MTAQEQSEIPSSTLKEKLTIDEAHLLGNGNFINV